MFFFLNEFNWDSPVDGDSVATTPWPSDDAPTDGADVDVAGAHFIYLFFLVKKGKTKKKRQMETRNSNYPPPPPPPMKKKEKIETTWPRTCPCDVIIPHRWRLLFPTPAIDRSRMAQ